jgi:hypothetical protein
MSPWGTCYSLFHFRTQSHKYLVWEIAFNEKATLKQNLDKKILHALAASCVQSRQFLASTLREQLFEIKYGMKMLLKKPENLRDTYL